MEEEYIYIYTHTPTLVTLLITRDNEDEKSRSWGAVGGKESPCQRHVVLKRQPAQTLSDRRMIIGEIDSTLPPSFHPLIPKAFQRAAWNNPVETWGEEVRYFRRRVRDRDGRRGILERICLFISIHRLCKFETRGWIIYVVKLNMFVNKGRDFLTSDKVALGKENPGFERV